MAELKKTNEELISSLHKEEEKVARLSVRIILDKWRRELRTEEKEREEKEKQERERGNKKKVLIDLPGGTQFIEASLG